MEKKVILKNSFYVAVLIAVGECIITKLSTFVTVNPWMTKNLGDISLLKKTLGYLYPHYIAYRQIRSVIRNLENKNKQ